MRWAAIPAVVVFLFEVMFLATLDASSFVVALVGVSLVVSLLVLGVEGRWWGVGLAGLATVLAIVALDPPWSIGPSLISSCTGICRIDEFYGLTLYLIPISMVLATIGTAASRGSRV